MNKIVLVSELQEGQKFRMEGDDSIYIMADYGYMVDINNGSICSAEIYEDEEAEILENVKIIVE